MVRWIAALSIWLATAGWPAEARAQEAVGDWHGALKGPIGELRIGVTIQRQPDGGLAGHLTSPDQGSASVPIQDIRVDEGRLTFTAPGIRGRYEGAWEPAEGAWKGAWTQGASLPLTLLKGPVPSRARPQVPTKPYPYREEEIAFDSAPGVRLAGTLTTPQGEGAFPAVVLITGSGPQDRDEALLGHRPFLVLADHLTRRGIAVLRYDDRGFAKSTGDFQGATSEDFAVDAGAAVAFLRSRREIDGRRIGLIGHSEGGMIAPMVAVKDPKVAFLVLLAGPGAPSRELMTAQRSAVMSAIGAGPEAIARSEALMSRVDAAVLQAKDVDEARQEVGKLLAESGGDMALPPAAVSLQAGQLSTPWYKFFIAFDPRPTLSKVRQPVLALNGDKDLQVVSSVNLPAVREALKANPDAEVVELAGLNHLFQTSATGDPREYGQIEETMAPEALETIARWVLARARR